MPSCEIAFARSTAVAAQRDNFFSTKCSQVYAGNTCKSQKAILRCRKMQSDRMRPLSQRLNHCWLVWHALQKGAVSAKVERRCYRTSKQRVGTSASTLYIPEVPKVCPRSRIGDMRWCRDPRNKEQEKPSGSELVDICDGTDRIISVNERGSLK